MNKNVLTPFLVLPFLILGVYLFWDYGIRDFLILNFITKNDTVPNYLDLDIKDKNIKVIKTLQEQLTTDDNKALGYTGQNKLALDSKGNIYFVYRQKINGRYEIFVTKVDENLSLIYNKAITTLSNTQRVPSITIDYKNNIHIVWYGLDGNNNGRQIKYIKSIDEGETWSDTKTIGPVNGYSGEDYWQEHPQISVYQNNLYVVWEGKDKNNKNQQIKFAKSVDQGNTWSSFKNVFETPNSTQSRPSVTIDSKGNLHLVFYSKLNENSQNVHYTTSTDKGETWTKPINLSNTSKNDSRHITASYLKNNLIVVWREGPNDLDKGFAQIYYSIFSIEDNMWTQPQMVAEKEVNQYFPNVTTNGTTALITWMENDSFNQYPNEDPVPGEVYISSISLEKKERTKPILIDKNSSYPSIILNVEKNHFYILYQKGLNPSEIILKSGK